jgi:hypothetical protein
MCTIRAVVEDPNVPRFLEDFNYGELIQEAWWCTQSSGSSCYLSHQIRLCTKEYPGSFAGSTVPLQNSIMPNRELEWATSDSGTIIIMKLKTISRRGHVIGRYFTGTPWKHFMSLGKQYREIFDVRNFLFKWDTSNQRQCNIDSDLLNSTKEINWSVNNAI